MAELANLVSLDLAANDIVDITPVAGLSRLSYLALDSNQISDIGPVAGLSNLEFLFLWSNQISDISPVAGHPILRRLNLGGNMISDISPVADLSSVTELYLNDNEISDISALTTTDAFGPRDLVDLRYNPLNRPSLCEHIPTLEDRGVIVFRTGECPPPAEWEVSQAVGVSDGQLQLDFVLESPEPSYFATYLILLYPEIRAVPLWVAPLPSLDPPVDTQVSFPVPFWQILGFYSVLISESGVEASDLDWIDLKPQSAQR